MATGVLRSCVGGHPMRDEAKFCQECGKPALDVDVDVVAAAPEDVIGHRCAKCGAEVLGLFCPVCVASATGSTTSTVEPGSQQPPLGQTLTLKDRFIGSGASKVVGGIGVAVLGVFLLVVIVSGVVTTSRNHNKVDANLVAAASMCGLIPDEYVYTGTTDNSETSHANLFSGSSLDGTMTHYRGPGGELRFEVFYAVNSMAVECPNGSTGSAQATP